MTASPPTPSSLVWSDALALDVPVMDQVHHEFVDLLERVVRADDSILLPHWAALIAHTRDHFEREDQWMQALGFVAENCHTAQHKLVLQVMRHGQAQGHRGDLQVVRHMAQELSQWFPQHAQTMDASLARHLRNAGMDPHTGALPSAAQPRLRTDAPPKLTPHEAFAAA